MLNLLMVLLVGAVLAALPPAQAGARWASPVVIDHHFPYSYGVGMTGVSCVTTTFCVGVDENGNVVTSTDPGGSPTDWTTVNVDGTTTLTGVSCVSVSLCVAVDRAGNVLTSASPGSGASSWTRRHVDAAGLSSVVCPSSGLCVATDRNGGIAVSTDPVVSPRLGA